MPFSLPIPAHPSRIPAILADCAATDLTLEQIAERHALTLDALVILLSSDEALEKIEDFTLAATVRIRAAAMSHLPRITATLSSMLNEYDYECRNVIPGRTPKAQSLRETQRSNARRAAGLLLRLANFTPTPIRRATDLAHAKSVRPSHTLPSSPQPPNVHAHDESASRGAPTPEHATLQDNQSQAPEQSEPSTRRLVTGVDPPLDFTLALGGMLLGFQKHEAEAAAILCPKDIHHASGNPEACHPSAGPFTVASG